MRTLPRLCVLFLLSAYACPVWGQQVEITIDKIVADQSISGHVIGLNAAAAGHHWVVVYVHTDVWYIHPYAGQAEGKSWASINGTGSWSIETVKRGFPADKIAALVINDTIVPPPRTESVTTIPHIAIIVKDLRSSGDFGKL